MTLRGYSVAFEGSEPPRSSQARPHWPADSRLGLRAPSPAARQAITSVTDATANIDEQLALIEMLIAVGPEVREEGTLHETLSMLQRLEHELGRRVAELVKACGGAPAERSSE